MLRQSDELLHVAAPGINGDCRAPVLGLLPPNPLHPVGWAGERAAASYFTPEELGEVFGGYDIEDIHLDERDHYCLMAFEE